MEEMTINHWAVFTSALFNLVLGALWYSPALFYNAWKQENGLTDEKLKQMNAGLVYTITLVLALIICYNLAFFLADSGTDWIWGTTAGFLAGFGWAAMIFTIIAMFEMRSWKYILINGGYIVVYFTVVGFIIGIWR